MKRRIICGVLLISLLLSTFSMPAAKMSTNGINILYETVTKETVVSGIDYENRKIVTENGGINVHVMQIDLKNPDVSIKVADSIDNSGKRDTVTNLLSSNGLVAGVNADFFDTSLSYTSPIGVYTKDNNLYNLTGINSVEKKYYTFYFDKENNAFMDVIQNKSDFYVNGNRAFGISGINSISNFEWPICIDSSFMTNTSQIDSRYKNLYKIIVEDGVITYISNEGETVNVPQKERGYIIVFSKTQYNNIIPFVKLNDMAEVKTSSTIDLSKIDFAISGGGKILDKGQLVNMGLVISGRHPRTAIGINKEQTKLVLMVIDGRGDSIGVTHNELGSLLLMYGAYDAMHFDGGGSSTMALNSNANSNIKVVNTPSDGSQRRVTNALGAVNNAEVGIPAQMKININQKKIFQYSGEPISVSFTDKNNKSVNSDAPVMWSVTGVAGKVENGRLYIYSKGVATITAESNGIKQSIQVQCLGAPTAIYSNSSLSLQVGKNGNIALKGISRDGHVLDYYYNAKYEVTPASMGTVERGVFSAKENGSGTIKVSVGHMSIAIPVVVGMDTVSIENFEKMSNVTASKYPAEVPQAEVGIVNIDKYEGSNSLALIYQFSSNITATQAAYFNPENLVIQEKNDSSFLSMWVKGDNSGNLLKINFVDSQNKEYLMELTNSINWSDWKYLQTSLPKDAVYPIKIKSIYTVSLKDATDDINMLLIDHISLTTSYKKVEANSHSGYKDYNNISISKAKKGIADIAFTGTMQDKATDAQNKIFKTLLANTNVVMGNKTKSNTSKNTGVKYWENQYKVYDYQGTKLVMLTLSKNSLSRTIGTQIKGLENELNNAKNNIIIYADKNPLYSSYKYEAEAVKAMLEKAAETKNVFVVCGGGKVNTAEVINGVRYLYVDRYDKDEALQGNKYLKIRIYEKELKYEFIDIK